MYKFKWELHVEGIKNYLTDDKYTIIPKYVKRFGKENFYSRTTNFSLTAKKSLLISRESKH